MSKVTSSRSTISKSSTEEELEEIKEKMDLIQCLVDEINDYLSDTNVLIKTDHSER